MSKETEGSTSQPMTRVVRPQSWTPLRKRLKRKLKPKLKKPKKRGKREPKIRLRKNQITRQCMKMLKKNAD
jgi:hypothetical protein